MTETEALFVTDRLDVRPWRDDEAPILFDIRRNAEVARWLDDPRPWTSLDQAHDHIAGWRAAARTDDGLGDWAVVPRDLGVPVGTVRLARLGDGSDVECGWYLHPDHTGKGYAAEAARGALAHAWRLGLARVHAIMWPDNEASARVARAAGMRDLGEVADPWYGTDEYPTSRMFLAERPEQR